MARMPPMKSPFPGMDPYLERNWGDVHSSIIIFAKQALQPQLGGDLVARNEERVYIDDDEALCRQHRVPDVRVVEFGITDIPVQPAGGVAIAEPVVIEVACDEITESFVQILDTRNGNRVVTVIEFVSPSNKLYKAARESYKGKQGECLAGRASLVEVDLTLAGKRELLVQDLDIPDSSAANIWSASIATVRKDGRREGYGLKLRERLPGIRIPLRAGDPDIVLDLQALVDQAYEVAPMVKRWTTTRTATLLCRLSTASGPTNCCEPAADDGDSAWRAPMEICSRFCPGADQVSVTGELPFSFGVLAIRSPAYSRRARTVGRRLG